MADDLFSISVSTREYRVRPMFWESSVRVEINDKHIYARPESFLGDRLKGSPILRISLWLVDPSTPLYTATLRQLCPPGASSEDTRSNPAEHSRVGAKAKAMLFLIWLPQRSVGRVGVDVLFRSLSWLTNLKVGSMAPAKPAAPKGPKAKAKSAVPKKVRS